MEFHVYETGETIRARHRPVVIITSNNEKELPDAFLRRCFFHYIRFPDMETMRGIVEVHYPGIKDELLTTALTQFYEIREMPGLKKKPSTSEVLDWLKLLLAEDLTPEDLRSDAQVRAAEAARRASEERTGRAALRTARLHGARGSVSARPPPECSSTLRALLAKAATMAFRVCPPSANWARVARCVGTSIPEHRVKPNYPGQTASGSQRLPSAPHMKHFVRPVDKSGPKDHFNREG